MVGFDPREGTLSAIEYGVAGSVSGMFTRATIQPLDVLKIRFQLQVEPMRSGGGAKYNGVIEALNKIVKEEGVTALWKGHVPAQVLSVVYGWVQFVSFEMLTRSVWQNVGDDHDLKFRHTVHFACGGLAGTLATVAAHPMDVLRTRFVAQGEPKIYRSLKHASISIVKGEGLLAFYKGLVPTLIQIAPHSGLQFGFYSIFTQLWASILGTNGEKMIGIQSLVCGSCAGTCAKSAIYPLDLIKKRLQVQGFEEARKSFGQTRTYTGMTHCALSILKEEGFRGLYKGLAPSLIKAMFSVGVSFCAYEQCCVAIRAMK